MKSIVLLVAVAVFGVVGYFVWRRYLSGEQLGARGANGDNGIGAQPRAEYVEKPRVSEDGRALGPETFATVLGLSGLYGAGQQNSVAPKLWTPTGVSQSEYYAPRATDTRPVDPYWRLNAAKAQGKVTT